MSQARAAELLNRTIQSVLQKIKTENIHWRGGCISCEALAHDIGCSSQTVSRIVNSISSRLYENGRARRYLIDAALAEKVKAIAVARLAKNGRHTKASEARWKNYQRQS